MEDQNKWKTMESEMDRFEAEISSLGSSSSSAPPSGAPPLKPAGLFIPASVVRRAAVTPGSTTIPPARPAATSGPVIISGAPQVYKANPVGPVLSKGPTVSSSTISAPPTSIQVQMPRHVRPSLIPGAPQITTAVNSTPKIISLTAGHHEDVKLKIEPNPGRTSDEIAMDTGSTSLHQKSPADAAASSSSSGSKAKKKKKKGDDNATATEKKPRKHVRCAGGTVWEDPTLLDWDPNDFRLFCGDLGNDVTDEVLARVFSRYPSFVKAKVVRDKRTNKTRGYGFVSFKDPNDFVRAIRELDGRYVGSRPIKLRKSTWKTRSLNQVRKREKEFKQLMGPKKAKLGML